MFADIRSELGATARRLRGRLEPNLPLGETTWFRVGGVAQLFFSPADEEDLAGFLEALPTAIPVTVLGLASNILVRDDGIAGAVIRLGARGFGHVAVDGDRLSFGTALPDVRAAQAAADAGLAGLAFYRGIPGAIGGALRMNAGAYGAETRDRLVAARALDRTGRTVTLSNGDFGFGYRHSEAPDELIFTAATFVGEPGDREAILAEMAGIQDAREASQPVKSRTGGSTFKNPPGAKAWELIDAAGCRGLAIGGAEVSRQHCNFLINTGRATALDLERLGEAVRARVKARCGVALEWEIRRFGRHPAGVEVAPFEEVR